MYKKWLCMHFRNLSTCFKPPWLSERRFCISNPFCEWAPLVLRVPPHHPRVPQKLAVKHPQDPPNCICMLAGTSGTFLVPLAGGPLLSCGGWRPGFFDSLLQGRSPGLCSPSAMRDSVAVWLHLARWWWEWLSVPFQTGRCCRWEQVVCANLLLTPDQSAPKPVPSQTGLQPSPGPGHRWCSSLAAYLEMLGSACAPGRTLYPGSPENYCPEKEPPPSGPRVGCTALLNKMFCV